VYFVTTKRAGYALFCMTPSERAAIGVTDDQQRVHLLERAGDTWRVRHEWPMTERSHTEIMVRLGTVEEPATVDAFVGLVLGA
jgi:hypothetical protein